MNKRTSLIALTSFTATFVALTAAFFSVTGIAKLFAGATFSVLIMASALELGKIVSISFLYQYWTEIPRLLKSYLTAAAFILMIITSVGIYGFLSGAYQITADKLAISDSRIEIINLRKNRLQDELTLSLQERDKVSTSIQELSRGLSNNVIQYRDQQSGQIMTTTSAATRTALQRQLDAANVQREKLLTKIENLSQSVSELDVQIVEARAGDELASEIGPLKFIADVTGVPINQIVNVFALMLVLVFDPLAVALVIAVNFLLKNKNTPLELPQAMPIVATPTPSVLAEPTVVSSVIETPTIVEEPVVVEEPIAPPVQPKPAPQFNKEVVKNIYDEWADRQYFTRDGFDWNNLGDWQHNPTAVEYYNRVIRPRQK